MKKEKCLTTEAMEKCQCEWCKLNREMTQTALESYVKLKALEIFYYATTHAGIGIPTKKLKESK